MLSVLLDLCSLGEAGFAERGRAPLCQGTVRPRCRRTDGLFALRTSVHNLNSMPPCLSTDSQRPLCNCCHRPGAGARLLRRRGGGAELVRSLARTHRLGSATSDSTPLLSRSAGPAVRPGMRLIATPPGGSPPAESGLGRALAWGPHPGPKPRSPPAPVGRQPAGRQAPNPRASTASPGGAEAPSWARTAWPRPRRAEIPVRIRLLEDDASGSAPGACGSGAILGLAVWPGASGGRPRAMRGLHRGDGHRSVQIP